MLPLTFQMFLSFLIPVIFVLDAMMHLNSLKIEEWALFLTLLQTLLSYIISLILLSCFMLCNSLTWCKRYYIIDDDFITGTVSDYYSE